MDSSASDAPMPHSPPITNPNRVRSTSRTIRLGAKADASSSAEYSRTSIIRIGRRPNLSASQPKKTAPNGRATRVRKIAACTAGGLT